MSNDPGVASSVPAAVSKPVQEDSPPKTDVSANATAAQDRTDATSLVTGLSPRAKTWIVFLPLVLVMATIGMACYWLWVADSKMELTAQSMGQLQVIAQKVSPDNPELASVLLVRLSDTAGHLKLSANHQARAVLVIGIGAALLAMGFALFVVGADGAFQLQAQGKGECRLLLYGMAAGCVCFVLAAILIGTSIVRGSTLATGQFQAGDAMTASQQDPAPREAPQLR